MSLSVSRLFSLLSLCLLAFGASVRGDEVAAAKPLVELYQLQLSFGGFLASDVPPKITTQIEVEQAFKVKVEESIPSPKPPLADGSLVPPTVEAYEASGILHAPQDGKFKLDCKVGENSDGAKREYEQTLELQLDKPLGRFMIASNVHGFRALLTKVPEANPVTPPANPTKVPMFQVVKRKNTFWGKETNGIQIALGPPSGVGTIYDPTLLAIDYLVRNHQIGNSGYYGVIVRNNTDKPVKLKAFEPRFAVPTVVDSEGNKHSSPQPVSGVPTAATERRTLILDAGKTLTLGDAKVFWRPAQKTDQVRSFDLAAGKYRMYYSYPIEIVGDDGTETKIELTTGERAFELRERPKK